MGACLCKGHQDRHLPMTVLSGQAEEGDPFTGKDSGNRSNGNVSDKTSGVYDIGELATSSLLGLVATVKEHITKPTAMAQGRVAHLIEWKGWGGGGEGTWSGGWSKAGGGLGAELHEDEQLYSQMTDEMREARFAAGVAEQFALAEAAMNVWLMSDSQEQPSTSLRAAESQFLSNFLLDGGSVGVPQHLYSIHGQAHDNDRTDCLAPLQQAASIYPVSTSQQDGHHPVDAESTVMMAEPAVRHVDSSSLSEDDVFYN